MKPVSISGININSNLTILNCGKKKFKIELDTLKPMCIYKYKGKILR